VERGRKRCAEEGLAGQISLVHGNACDTGLPAGSADFVWGEDAWCYVEDKEALVAEAARLVRPGGTIAFTDWVEGAVEMTAEEARRYLTFMKFPSVLDLKSYRTALERNGCRVLVAEDTEICAPAMDLYLDMLGRQLTYDALKIIGWDRALFESLGAEMVFLQRLAHAGKFIQARFVARKN